MSENNLKAFLKARHIHDLTQKEQLISLVKDVANIPWGEARTVQEVLTLKKGTCTGKHKVLQAAFAELGVPYKTVVCTFRWGEQRVQYPSRLQKILDEGGGNTDIILYKYQTRMGTTLILILHGTRSLRNTDFNLYLTTGTGAVHL